MYINLFSKNPNSPWSGYAGFFGREVKLLRWGQLTALILLVIVGGGVRNAIKDGSFIRGSTQTVAHFVNVSNEGPGSNNTTNYTATYQYQASGSSYSVNVQRNSQNPVNFSPTARVVYRTDNPGDAETIYRSSPLGQVAWDIAAILITCAVFYAVLYGIALFGKHTRA